MPKYYFRMVEHPIEAGQAAGTIYNAPDRDTCKAFEALNGFSSAKDMLYPGQLILAPSLDGFSTDQVGATRDLIEASQYAWRNSPGRPNPTAFNENFEVLEHLATHNSKYDIASQYFGGVGDYLEWRTNNITKDLNRLQDVYRSAQAQKIHLSSPTFSNMRRPIQDALKAQLTGFSKGAILKHAHAPNMKDAIGISHKSITKQIKTTGSPIEVKQISKAIGKADKLAKAVKPLGVVGRVLSIGSTVGELKEAYQSGGTKLAVRTATREAAGMAGAAGASAAAGAAATAALLAFGVGTGGLGFVAAGIGVIAAGIIGGEVGEQVHGAFEEEVGGVTDSAVDWLEEVALP